MSSLVIAADNDIRTAVKHGTSLSGVTTGDSKVMLRNSVRKLNDRNGLLSIATQKCVEGNLEWLARWRQLSRRYRHFGYYPDKPTLQEHRQKQWNITDGV